jgi:shikimate dehydrogenase
MKYGLLGEHLSHSYSQIIHEKLGLYAYELFPMPPERIGVFLATRGFAGLNVTIPYKTAVAKYCDVIDPEAKAIGAINTMYFKAGGLHGTNTDYYGLAYAAKRAGISFQDKKVLILGGGGTSCTAQALSSDSGAAELFVAERKPKQHADGINFISYANLPHDAEIIVNTTPVGMFPNNLESIIHLSDFPKCVGVLDVIYNPFSTVLILEAKELGIPNSGGLPMLVAQASRAAELFTGRKDLHKETERIILELENELCNIVLTGMPGSGKTTLGKKLANKINKTFVDLDREIEKVAGKSIPEIFQEDGEPKFRELETQVAMEFGKQKGLVISTGGGVLLNPLNAMALKQNGKMVFIDRPVPLLATSGRPLSTSQEALAKMEQERRPFYEKNADVILLNRGPFIKALSALVEIAK